MMAAILHKKTSLNSAILIGLPDTAILDWDTLLSSLRFTQKHSHSTLTLTQTNSIWLTWWWQPSWILNSAWIQTPCYLLWDSLKNTLTPLTLTQTNSIWFLMMHPSWNLGFSHFAQKKTSLIHSHSTWWCQPSWILPSWIQPFWTKKTSLIHSDSTWWWQPSWILPCWIQTLPSWIQTPCYLLSDSLKNTLTPLWLWLKLIQSDSNSFILTSLDDVSHLEFCHLGFSHFEQIKTSHSLSLNLRMAAILPFYHLGFSHICTKKTSLIHSDSTWWWQPSWILPCWIQTLPSWIETPCYLLSDSLKNTLTPLWLWLKLIQSD